MAERLAEAGVRRAFGVPGGGSQPRSAEAEEPHIPECE
jgi:hypothetical protein